MASGERTSRTRMSPTMRCPATRLPRAQSASWRRCLGAGALPRHRCLRAGTFSNLMQVTCEQLET